jgi:folate-binding protein YgfZ
VAPDSATEVLELDAQYRAMREGAGLLDRSGRGKLTVAGAEAAEYLQGQLSNEIKALDADRGCYALLLDPKAKIQADMRVLRLEDGKIWLDLEPEATEATLRHLRTYSIGRELEISDVGDRWAISSLIGPASDQIAGIGGLAPEHAQRHSDREGIEVLAVATDLGLDLISRADQSGVLRRGLLEAGAEQVSEDGAEILRVESGRPRLGREMGPGTMPAEAGVVERAINFEKGCYIGQEPVARLHYRGRPNRTLRGLRLGAPAPAGAAIRTEEREVGTIGTACISPANGPIALAVIRREAGPGTTVEVEGGAGGEVVELPFGDL